MKEKLLKSLLDPLISSSFDPQPITFRRDDERGVLPVRNVCQKAPTALHRFRSPLNRNAFLCGCLDSTEPEEIEHIIFGFGHRHGLTTKVTGAARVEGEANRVSIPDALQQAVFKHVGSDHRAEVLIFHNHPRNVLNIALDNHPLASGTDRETLLGYYVQPLVAVKSLMGGGRVRCYLGENGFVREFRTPNLLSLLNRLSGAAK